MATKIPLISLIVLIIIIGILSFLLIRRLISLPEFLSLCVVWIFLAVLIISGGKAELWFSLIALIVSLLTFALQNSPLLVLNDLAVVESGQKLYLYFQNKGAVPTYQLKGSFALTTHDEVENRKTSNEKVIASGPIFAIGEAFYPSVNEKDVNFISLELGLKTPFENIQGHRYFSISVRYPRLPFWNFDKPKIPYLWKGYQGVFVYEPKDGKWYRSSKTHLPEFFQKIFLALNEGNTPPFPVLDR